MKITFNKTELNMAFSSSTLENLVFVDVLIHGELIPMVFDTGASMTIISSSVSSLVQAKSTGEVLKGGGNAGIILTAEKRTLQNLSIGSTLIENLSVMVLPDENLVFCPDDSDEKIQVHGFLGWDVISRICWHLDMKRRILFIEEPEKQADKSRNLLWDHMPILQIAHEEDTLFFGLDTGNTETLLTNQEYFIKEHPFFTEDEIQGLDGPTTEDVIKLESFSFLFDKAVFHLGNLSILDRPIFPTDEVEVHGLFGMDFLKDKILILDFTNRHLQIK